MTDTIITLRSLPRRSVPGADMTAKYCVRAYRHSPDGVTLQIRREKDYTTAWLTFDEALELAEALKQAINR